MLSRRKPNSRKEEIDKGEKLGGRAQRGNEWEESSER